MAAVLPVLRDVKLDDKYELESGRVFLTGAQAFVRLLILQRQRDALAGLDTAGFVSGYRGSPLGALDQSLWKAKKFLDRAHVRFQPGLERGPRRDVDLGHAAAQPPQGREGRWRLRDVVRQGSGCGPLRRRIQARQHGGHVEARRRAGAGRRRPCRQVVDGAAPIGPSVLGGDDPGAVSVVGAGDPGPGSPRLGDVALLGLLGRVQVRRRHRREQLLRVDRSGAHEDHRARRLPAAAGRRVDPLARRLSRHRSADAGLQDLRGAALLPCQRAEQDRHRFPRFWQTRAPRHRDVGQELPGRPAGAGRPGHHRTGRRRNGPARLQDRDAVAARTGRRPQFRRRARRDPRRRGKAADRRVPAEGAALQLAGRRAAARRRQVRRKGRMGAPARRLAAAGRRRADAGDDRAGDRQAHRAPEPHSAPDGRAARARRLDQRQGKRAGQAEDRPRPPALLLFRLPAQHVDEAPRRQPRHRRHRLPRDGDLDGPQHVGVHAHGRRRRDVDRPGAVHRREAHLRQPGRRHVLPQRHPGDPRRRRRERQHHVQDPLQRRGGDDRRPAVRRAAHRRRHREAGGGRRR